MLFFTGFTVGLGLKNWVLLLVLPLVFLADPTGVSSSPCSLTPAIELCSSLWINRLYMSYVLTTSSRNRSAGSGMNMITLNYSIAGYRHWGACNYLCHVCSLTEMFLSQILFQPASKSFLFLLSNEKSCSCLVLHYHWVSKQSGNTGLCWVQQYQCFNYVKLKTYFLVSNIQAGGMKAMSVTQLLKRDSTSQGSQITGVLPFSSMTCRRECSVGVFILSFKTIVKPSAYWGLGSIQGLFSQFGIWVPGLQSIDFFPVLILTDMQRSHPCWLVQGHALIDVASGPVCLLGKSVVLRYCKGILTGPFSIRCTRLPL